MATYLDRILAKHRAVADSDDRDLSDLVAATAAWGPPRGFRRAILDRPDGELGVIGEIKRRSPSKGDLNLSLDPAAWAVLYESAGASCLSVLTDEEFFGGSAADLGAAAAACSLPVLRKDFTVSEFDVCDARLMGADCVLLIVAALSASELLRFHRLAVDIGLDVLVEIHDEPELDRALDVGAELIGVNQRDLVTFQVDHDRALRMAGLIPDSVVKVAESGVRHAGDARSLREAGYDAVLVGETLVTASDPASTLASLKR
jgi:indole-3-glycerol phosphate synthase